MSNIGLRFIALFNSGSYFELQLVILFRPVLCKLFLFLRKSISKWTFPRRRVCLLDLVSTYDLFLFCCKLLNKAEIRITRVGQGEIKIRNIPIVVTPEGFWCRPFPVVFQKNLKGQNSINRPNASNQ